MASLLHEALAHLTRYNPPNFSSVGLLVLCSTETESDISSWTSQIHRATVATVMSVKVSQSLSLLSFVYTSPSLLQHCFYAGTCEDRHISLGLDIDRGILILDDSVRKMLYTMQLFLVTDNIN